MPETGPAPNRLLDLRELDRPDYAELRRRLEEMAALDRRLVLHPSKRWEYPWALERADLPPGSRVLDAGCGASVLPYYLAAEGHRVAGCDPAVEPGRAGCRPHVDHVSGDLADLPFAGRSFDVVFCISVIEHLPHGRMPGAMQEMHRVLRPGGKLLLTTDFAEDASTSFRYEGPGPPFDVDWNVFDENRLRKIVLQARGWAVAGRIDLRADWSRVRREMPAFHGYAYTAVGVALVRE